IGAIPTYASQRIIHAAADVNWRPADQRSQAGNRPAAQRFAHEALLFLPRGNLVVERRVEYMSAVLVGAGPVGPLIERILRERPEIGGRVVVEIFSERVSAGDSDAVAEAFVDEDLKCMISRIRI